MYWKLVRLILRLKLNLLRIINHGFIEIYIGNIEINTLSKKKKYKKSTFSCFEFRPGNQVIFIENESPNSVIKARYCLMLARECFQKLQPNSTIYTHTHTHPSNPTTSTPLQHHLNPNLNLVHHQNSPH